MLVNMNRSTTNLINSRRAVTNRTHQTSQKGMMTIYKQGFKDVDVTDDVLDHETFFRMFWLSNMDKHLKNITMSSGPTIRTNVNPRETIVRLPI